LGSRFPIKEVPFDRFPPVFIQDPQFLFLLSYLIFERLPAVGRTVSLVIAFLWAPCWVTQAQVLIYFSIGQVTILRSQHLFLF
jgi:hypothetical protein